MLIRVKGILQIVTCIAILLIPLTFASAEDSSLAARKRVQEAVDYWRDNSSYTASEMIIHRPDWTRRTKLEAWTSGRDQSLVRFTAPPKDAGNATLTLENDTWTFSPKVNRIIKIPPSMMTQSWMGSDFSYRDISRSDDILELYTHQFIGREEHDGLQVDIVESIPHEEAAVVWGKEILKIRSDHIVLEHSFFDQSGKLVKRLVAKDIQLLGGKLYPRVTRMESAEKPEEWTEVVHEDAKFNLSIPTQTFTLSNLSNPRNR